jgi:hypothetical protein
MFANAINFDKPVGIWLAQQHVLCMLLSIATIFFEIFFFISLFFRKSVVLFLIGGVLLHVGIFVTMSAPFFQHILLYSVFINFERYLPVARRSPSVSQVNTQILRPLTS